MREFTVQWKIEVSANTPEEAARQALEIQRDPTTSATWFRVKEAPRYPAWVEVDGGALASGGSPVDPAQPEGGGDGREAVVDGVTYGAKPETLAGTCDGCAGNGGGTLCSRLPGCSGEGMGVIWVRK